MKKEEWIIGIDEVGRGPLAGPVMVCGVLMPIVFYKKTSWKGLTDSKKLTKKSREAWFVVATELEQAHKIYFHIAQRSAKEIDQRGISVCIKECITEILDTLLLLLHKNSKLILSDSRKRVKVELDGGLKAPAEFKNQKTIIKGDVSQKIISLASVIAKVTRNAYMESQHKKYPQYDWKNNKGYGTKTHRQTIKKEGTTPLHRQSYLTRIIDK